MKNHSEEFYKKQHAKYLKAYERARQLNAKSGLPMSQQIYGYEQFKFFYNAASNDPDILAKKKSIASQLANRQRYEYDYNRAQKQQIARVGREFMKKDPEYKRQFESGEIDSVVAYAWSVLGWSNKQISSDIFGSS